MRLFILLQEIYSADIRAECPITSKHFQLLPPVKRIISLLTLLIAYVGMAMAQQTLSGTVVDSKTGEKLPFVNVVYTVVVAHRLTLTDTSRYLFELDVCASP